MKGEISLHCTKQSLFVQNETCSVDTRQVSSRLPAIHLVLSLAHKVFIGSVKIFADNSSNHNILCTRSCTKYGVVSFPLHEHSELQHLDSCYKQRFRVNSFSQEPLLSSDNLVDIEVIHAIKWTRPFPSSAIPHSCVVLIQTRPHTWTTLTL